MKLNGKSRVSGRVRFMVLDVLGKVKKGERSFWRRFFGLQAGLTHEEKRAEKEVCWKNTLENWKMKDKRGKFSTA